MNEKILEEYSVKIYETDLFFYEHHKEKIKVEKNGCEYILFRIDVYFTEYFSDVEITDYEVSKIQTFISKFKDRQLKKIRKRTKQKNKRKRKQNKQTRRRNKKLETLINNSKCLKWIVKNILPNYTK